MSRIWIKICGVRTPGIADVVADAGADAIGLVFAEQSPRFVTDQEARAVLSATPVSITPVGLFVDPDDQPARPVDLAEQLGLRALQLHGRADVVTALAEAYRVIRVVSFDPTDAQQTLRRVDRLAASSPAVTAVVIDTPDPSGIGGGTGCVFDWSMLRAALDQIDPVVPVILAGGLTPDNVAEAIQLIRPWGVDVSSGVESSRGVKDRVGFARSFKRRGMRRLNFKIGFSRIF